VRLIVTPAEAVPAESNDQQQLIHTLAQAQLWLEQLLSGEVSSLRMIANSVGLSERYVSRIIRCAFLAPDLVEAILHGAHWPRLSLRKVAQHLPLDRSEQRHTFGLPADKAGIAG
jgi:site-specific DNA recombinase